MRNGDFYDHYKGKEYFFDSIALPMDELLTTRNLEKNGVALDAHTPDGLEPQELQLCRTPEGITVIAAPVPHVIYQSEEDYNTDKVWARRVDDFFGFVGGIHQEKRFAYKGRD